MTGYANTPTVVVVLVPVHGGLLISVAPCPVRARDSWRSPAAIKCSGKPGRRPGRPRSGRRPGSSASRPDSGWSPSRQRPTGARI